MQMRTVASEARVFIFIITEKGCVATEKNISACVPRKSCQIKFKADLKFDREYFNNFVVCYEQYITGNIVIFTFFFYPNFFFHYKFE